MKKFIFSLVWILSGIFAVSAMADGVLDKQFPIDKNVKYGVLPNGMTYYIRHNAEPKNRAEFHIAQKVGSVLEEENQRGLAHFLEHMAFNGTTHYPGKSMLEYLQNNGMTFGGDINAYTGFDKTVYRVSNVPTEREALLDSVLLVLHDWSCEITLDPKEIDDERGVIHEEWRTRGDANQRLYEVVVPQIFKGSRYANRMPIGSMDVVMNFKPQELRDYYHRWYRPDQQGLIIVGDFDAAKMEQKVKDLFSPIKMPKNPAKREYFPVPDHKGIDYALYTDPESANNLIYMFFQHSVTPREQKNTFAYARQQIITGLSSMMLNDRFGEIVQTPESPFMYAYSYDSDFFIAATKDAYTLIAVPKDGKVLDTYKTMLTEAQRVNLHGFTETELERAKAEYKAYYEQVYNERDKQKSRKYAEEYINHFTDGGYIAGIETEFKVLCAFLPSITLEEVNNYAQNTINEDNVSLIISGPEKASVPYPTKDEIESNFKTIFSSQVDAYADQVSNEPLLEKEPVAGKIVSETTDAATDITTMKLSNGATVLLKPTNFKNDEILMTATSLGGYWSYKGADNADIRLFDDAVDASALGNYTRKALNKYLAGKKVSISYSTNSATETVSGSSNKKDLETLFQLNYLTFTDVRKDEQAFEATRSALASQLSTAANNPNYVLKDSIYATLYGHLPEKMLTKVSDVQAANYDNCLKLFRDRVSNAGDFTFAFVGSFDIATMRPLIEKYIASLPDNGVREKTSYKTSFVPGKVNNNFDFPMKNPKTSVYVVMSGDMKYSLKNTVMMDMLSEVMDIVYTRTIREEEGGTYGVATSASISSYTNKWDFLYTFDTNGEAKDKLTKRAQDELMNVINNGAQATDFQKVKEAAIKQYENNLRDNKFWRRVLNKKAVGIDSYTGLGDILKNVTLEDFNKFIKKNLSDKNKVSVVMNGVKSDK